MEPPADAPPKPTRERTPAQAEATKKMLQALQEKRRADWEKKKNEVINKYGEKIKQVVSEEPEPEKPKLKPAEELAPPPAPVTAPTPAIDVEALKQQIRDELMSQQSSRAKPKAKPKKKVVVEESDSSSSEEEVVVIRKKKSKASLVPKPVSTKPPRKADNPYAMLESMFFKQHK
jgi:hypothetical protein